MNPHPVMKRDATARARALKRTVTSLDRLMVLAAQRRSVYLMGSFGLRPAAWVANLQGRHLHFLFSSGLVLEYPAGKKTRAVRLPGGLMQETRPCKDCRFMSIKSGQPICTKKWMGVLADMRVTFKANEGSCFQPKRKHGQSYLAAMSEGEVGHA